MRSIPRNLYSKNILSYIRDLISFDDAKDFYSLDELHQDQLVAFGIEALDGDIDIILSSDANTLLAKFLTSYDRDDEIELNKAVKQSAREKFADWFDDLIQEELESRKREALYEAGRRPIQDRINGETLWI